GEYGVLHTETSTPSPNRLGQFFTEWNVRLDRKCVGGYCKPDSIRVYVNGKVFTGNPRTILLADHTEIAIVIGTAPMAIPKRFPTNAPFEPAGAAERSASLRCWCTRDCLTVVTHDKNWEGSGWAGA